jgi:2-desacetyl-2-hydroxyethyl bacteriochlorophyllide A dehydrogenase
MNNELSQVESRRIVFPGPFQVEYEHSTIEALASDEVLIQTEYSLISPGTELALYTGTHVDLPNPNNKFAKFPFYPGYASVGIVTAVGSGVNAVRQGDRVFAQGHHFSHDVLTYSEENIIKLPDVISSQHATFSRLVEISMTSLILSRYKEGDCVVVIGMGMIGNFAAQLFGIKGARVIGVDVIEKRLETARACGIECTVHSGPGVDIRDEIRKLNGGKDADIVVEATGVPTLVNLALQVVRMHGQVILLGSTRGKVEMNVYADIHKNGVSLIGAHGRVKGVDGLPTLSELMRYSLKLIEKGSIVTEPLLTHIICPEEAKTAYDMLLNQKENALGVLIDWTK